MLVRGVGVAVVICGFATEHRGDDGGKGSGNVRLVVVVVVATKIIVTMVVVTMSATITQVWWC